MAMSTTTRQRQYMTPAEMPSVPPIKIVRCIHHLGEKGLFHQTLRLVESRKIFLGTPKPFLTEFKCVAWLRFVIEFYLLPQDVALSPKNPNGQSSPFNSSSGGVFLDSAGPSGTAFNSSNPSNSFQNALSQAAGSLDTSASSCSPPSVGSGDLTSLNPQVTN